MQTDNRFLDDLSKLATGAASALGSVRAETEGVMRAWLDRRLSDLDLVTREEFDTVKDMAIKAREENERLSQRVTALEEKLGAKPQASETRAPTKKKTASAKAKTRNRKAGPAKSTGAATSNKI